MPQKSTSAGYKTGKRAEDCVASVLRGNGHKVNQMPCGHPFDLLVNAATKIEVKGSVFTDENLFTFNFHRHGVLDEKDVDFYILRLEAVPGFKNAIHLMFRAPIGVKTMRLSLRSLLYRYGENAVAFEKFLREEKFKDRRVPDDKNWITTDRKQYIMPKRLRPSSLPPVKEWEKIRIAPDVMRSVVSRTKTSGLKPQHQINHDLRRMYLSKKLK